MQLTILCNPEESDAIETSPGNACQGFVHIWKCSTKITGSTSTKNWSGLISQEDEIIKLHKLCNLHNLWSYVILRRVMRWKPLPVMLVRDLSIYGSAALKITGSTSTKNWSGLIFQEDEIIKLHNLWTYELMNLWAYD